MTQIPRPEHPQPQMKREHWKNLNGEWDFSFDFGCSGIDQKSGMTFNSPFSSSPNFMVTPLILFR